MLISPKTVPLQILSKLVLVEFNELLYLPDQTKTWTEIKIFC